MRGPKRTGPAPPSRHPRYPTPRDRRFGNDPGDGDIVPESRGTFPAVAPAVDRAVELWIAWMTKRLLSAAVTAATYRQYLTVVRSWMTWLAERRITAPTAHDAADFLAWGRDHAGWSHLTLLSYRTALRSLYAWVAQRGLGSDLAANLTAPAMPPPAIAPELRPRHVRSLLSAIAGTDLRAHRDRVIVALLYAGTLEPISLHRARRRDYDAATGVLRHQPRGARRATAVVTLDGTTRRLMEAYLQAAGRRAARDPLIVAIHGLSGNLIRRPLSTLSMRLLVRRALDTVFGSDPALHPLRSRSTSRTPQRPATRALRRSGLAALARQPQARETMLQRGVDGTSYRLRQALGSMIPLRSPLSCTPDTGRPSRRRPHA